MSSRPTASALASVSVALSLLLTGISWAHASDKSGPSGAAAACPRPEYPEQARKQNHQGTVKLRFLLGADGKVRRTLVASTSGYPALDEAARRAVSTCRFDSRLHRGEPVEEWRDIQYVFQTSAPRSSGVIPFAALLPFLAIWLVRRRSGRPSPVPKVQAPL